MGIGIFFTSLIFFLVYETSKMNDINNEKNVEVTDEYIIDRATEMGMIFFNNVYFQKPTTTDGSNVHDKQIVVSPEDFVYVTIPKNSTAIEVAKILEEDGLISDSVEFTNYIIQANLQRQLQYGNFLVPKNATNEELASILIN